jgi:uncharacterized protein (TIGR04222 family)
MLDLHLASILFLPGPQFLNLYGIVAIIVLAGAYLIPTLADATRSTNPPRVPATPDPIELAYLSGGVNSVIRTIVYDLRQRSFATLEGETHIAATPNIPAPGVLTPMQSRVLRAIQTRLKIGALFKDKALRNDMERLLEPVRQRLARDSLLTPPSVKTARNWTVGLGVVILAGLAGAKLFIAHKLHKTNVEFLIFLAIASLFALFFIAAQISRRIASRRGRAWLEALRLAYAPRLKSTQGIFTPPLSGATAVYDGGALFLIGLFGFEALNGTADAEFAKAFKRASASDGGGGCGGSSGGGGGDGGGGGCGGCGGGGGD